jgi:hypothetical protein
VTDTALPDLNPQTIPIPADGPFLVVVRLSDQYVTEEDHEALRAFSAALLERVGDRVTLIAVSDNDGVEVLADDDLAQLGLVRLARVEEAYGRYVDTDDLDAFRDALTAMRPDTPDGNAGHGVDPVTH